MTIIATALLAGLILAYLVWHRLGLFINQPKEFYLFAAVVYATILAVPMLIVKYIMG